ncbi:FHA domain-containing protein [Elusimicrobiota bacterium]
MPKLLLKFNAAVIKEIALDKPTLTIGRKADNDIVIDNPAVSGYHCKIALKGDTYFLEDLESTNGTFLNEKRVMKAGLHDSDVVGVARHALVFVGDAPQGGDEAGDETMVVAPEKQQEMVEAASASAGDAESAATGHLKVLKGGVTDPEFELKGLSTYIGKSDRAQIQIKGSGLFGSAPDIAASIHRKPEGFVLMAIKDGYPVVNGKNVSGQVALNDGDIIECGGTTLQFSLKQE